MTALAPYTPTWAITHLKGPFGAHYHAAWDRGRIVVMAETRAQLQLRIEIAEMTHPLFPRTP